MDLIRYWYWNTFRFEKIWKYGEVNSRTTSLPILSSRLACWKCCHPARVRGSVYDDEDDDDDDDDDDGDHDDDSDDEYDDYDHDIFEYTHYNP